MTTNDTSPTETETAAESNVVELPAKVREPAHKQVAGFVHDHPMLTLAGGLALGAVAAALIPRRNRKFIARRSSLLAQAVTAATTALAQQAISHAASAGAAARDQAETLADRAGHIGKAALDRAGSVGETSLARAQSLLGHVTEEPTLRDRIAAKAGEFRGRLDR